MSPSRRPSARTGFASARQAARRAWLVLAAVALVPGWAMVRIIPGFLTVGATPPLSDGAPNLWAIVQALPYIGGLQLAGMAMAMACGAAAWLTAHFSTRPPRGKNLLPAALLIALLFPGLLPQMQPCDFLLAIGLSIAWTVRERDIVVAPLVTGGWLLAIVAAPAFGAVPLMVATLLIARPFLASPANDNGPPLNRLEPFSA